VWDGLTASSVDYAIGMAGGTLWYSVPNNSTAQHQWFGGTSSLMTLLGTGTLTVSGSVGTPTLYATGTNGYIGFANRTSPGAGDWGWYASGGVARLYNGADRLQIDASGNITMVGNYFNWPGGGALVGDPTNVVIRMGTGNGSFYIQNNAQSVSYHSFDMGGNAYHGGVVTVVGSYLKRGGGPSYRMSPNADNTGYGSFWYIDGATTYLLLTNNNDAWGRYNGLRPIAVKNSNGLVTFGHWVNFSAGITLTNSNASNVIQCTNGANYLQMFNDGNGHIECANTQLWINSAGGQPTYFGGSINAYDISSRNNLNCSGNIGCSGTTVSFQGFRTGLASGAGPIVYGDTNWIVAMCGGGNQGFMCYNSGGGSFFQAKTDNSLVLANVKFVQCDAANTGYNKLFQNDGSTIAVFIGTGITYNRNNIHMIESSAAATWVRIDGNGVQFSCNAYPTINGSYICGGTSNAWAFVYANNFTNPSDPRLKQDIEPVPPSLDRVRALSPITYRWRQGIDTKRRHHGFSADDVRDVLGEDFGGYIHNREDDTKAIVYNELTAVLWKAVQELIESNGKLIESNSVLAARVAALEAHHA
jgi:hypothetical protein